MSEISWPAEGANYKGYLVRLWRSDARSYWRASAQDIQTGHRYHFARLENLFLFLGEQTTDAPDSIP
jgi:hypothetical protein